MQKNILSVIRGETPQIDELFASLSEEIRTHSQGVAKMARRLAQWALEDFPEDLLALPPPEQIERAALYHDIGFALVPNCLFEREKLSGAELHVLHRHSGYGGSLLEERRKQCPAYSDDARFWGLAAEIALNHHERWDGKGYPFGQLATAVPTAARIVAIANAYDRMVRGSSYRMPLPPEYAILEILHNAGRQFDPTLAECFRSRHHLILDI